MTTLMEFFGHPLVHALGWTLLHFFWQGAAIAGLLWCVLALLCGRSSQARYGASCFALVLLVALPLTTFAHMAANEYRMRTELKDLAIPADADLIVQVGMGEPGSWAGRMAVTLDHLLPWMLALWFAGVLFFVARLNFGLLVTRRIRSLGTELPDEDLLLTFDTLRERLGIARAVRLLHSARVQVPTVIGWLRPVVLIPASCLTGLSKEQIEAIFCHELAHVRRHDYLVSVFQSVVEALLFYHPAVWWVSKQVRRERECCCDEVAIAMGSDVLAYAKALSFLEERRASFPEFVLGANGGVLTMRIKRLLGFKENTATSQFAAFTVLAAILAMTGSYVVATARAQQQAQPAQRVSPESTAIAQAKTADPPASSTAPVGGSIGGTVVDPSGAVVARANLRLANAETGQKMTQVTDSLGSFTFSHLPSGTYNLEVMVPGFQGLHQENVRVEEGKRVGLNLKLRVGSVAENLTVAAPAAAAAPAPPPPPSPPAISDDGKRSGPVRISAGVAAGMIISKVDPTYPPEAKEAHVQGVVVLHAIISKTGDVENLQVIGGPPPLLVSSIDAVRQWKYKPFLLNGEPIEVETTININYSLNGPSDPQGPGGYASVEPKKIGDGVLAPRVIYQVDPEYSAEAKQAKFSGIVLVHLVVDEHGVPQDVHVLRSVGMGLDAKALEAVKQYRFRPGMENGKPVPVELNVEVSFRAVPDATTTVMPILLRTATPTLIAKLEPTQFSRMLFFRPTQLAQTTPSAPPSAATQSAAPQAAPAQPKGEFNEEQRAQFDNGIAAAKREAAEAAKRLNSPEFRKQLEDAQREAMDAAKRLNTPEFKQNFEEAQRKALEAGKRFDTPEFRKQIEDAQRQALEAAKKFNSSEFQKQMDVMRQQMDERNMNLDNREFRKAMEEVRRQINAATEELREAGYLTDPPSK